METLTIRINKEDKEFLKAYAKFYDISLSDLLRQSAIDKAENDIDRILYTKAEKILADSKREDDISFDVLVTELGLDNDM